MLKSIRKLESRAASARDHRNSVAAVSRRSDCAVPVHRLHPSAPETKGQRPDQRHYSGHGKRQPHASFALKNQSRQPRRRDSGEIRKPILQARPAPRHLRSCQRLRNRPVVRRVRALPNGRQRHQSHRQQWMPANHRERNQCGRDNIARPTTKCAERAGRCAVRNQPVGIQPAHQRRAGNRRNVSDVNCDMLAIERCCSCTRYVGSHASRK